MSIPKTRPWRLYRGVSDDRVVIGTFSSHEAALRRAKALRAAGASERSYRISGPAPLPGANDACGWDRVRTYGLGRRWYEIV